MPADGLPPGFDQLFPDHDAEHVLDVDLPPGRLVVTEESGTSPAYWLSDGPASPDLWVALHTAHGRSGLWPVLANGHWSDADRPWVTGEALEPGPLARIDQLDARAVLEGFWKAEISGEHLFLEPVGDDPREMAGEIKSTPRRAFPELEPFAAAWPGLAPAGDLGGRDPDQFADQHLRETDDGTSRIMLVPAARGADLITAVGWVGPCNYTSDLPLLSSVLRSWEDRFGARVIEIGFDILHLAVAAPPVTAEHAELTAAEHFAFCPDNVQQGDLIINGVLQTYPPTIRSYAAARVLGKNDWWFWWD